MPHRIDYSGDGSRARVTIDLDGASLDRDVGAIGSQWQTLKNVLTHIPGVLPKRGAITDAGANTTDINDASGVLAFYDGPLRGGATYRPYVGVAINTSTTLNIYTQSAASSRATIITAATEQLYPLPTSKCPTVDERLILCGRYLAYGTASPRAGVARLIGGTSRASAYNTGTVTTTTGSVTVTGSGTTWTTDMAGLMVDFGATPHYGYVVKSVESATSLTLDRPVTSGAGAGLAYVLTTIAPHYTLSTGIFGTDSYARYRLAASAYGRLLVGHTWEPGASTSFGTTSPEFPYRLRWTGTIGSDEGSGLFLGIHAFHADGYVDVPSRFGYLQAVVPFRDSVLVFQSSGLTVLHGSPVYDGSGSLDLSEVHPGVAINGGFAYEITPEGVFFFDKQVGPCVYDGSRVQRIGDARVTRTMLVYGITEVGYYDGKVLFSGTTSASIFVFDTRTSQWSQQVPPAIVSCLIPGRVENDEDVVGLGSGTQVVNLANMFDAPGVAATDWDGTAFVVDIKTGKIGDTLTQLRPERAWFTYRLTDLTTTNPYLTASIQTGLDMTVAAQYHTNAATELIEHADVKTRLIEVNLERNHMAQVRVLQVNGAGALELYAIILDCAVEGEGAS